MSPQLLLMFLIFGMVAALGYWVTMVFAGGGGAGASFWINT